MNLEDRLVRDVKEKRLEATRTDPDSKNPEPRMREMRSWVPWKRTRVTAENTKAKRPVTICR